MTIARFIGDPTGYKLITPNTQTGWTHAHIGRTDKVVKINLDQAYLLEPDSNPDPPDPAMPEATRLWPFRSRNR